MINKDLSPETKKDFYQAFAQIRQECFTLKIIIREGLERSREKSLAFTSIEKAQLFAGNLLGTLNFDNYPYKNSLDPSNEKIDPLFKLSEEESKKEALEFIEGKNEIIIIKEIRVILHELVIAYASLVDNISKTEFSESQIVLINTCYQELRLAKNYLGMQLGNIKNN